MYPDDSHVCQIRIFCITQVHYLTKAIKFFEHITDLQAVYRRIVLKAVVTSHPNLTTSHRLTCIHDLRCYSRNSYCNFGRHAIFSESSRSPLTKGTANNDRAHSFCGFFCLIPLSNQQVSEWRNISPSSRGLSCWIIGRCVSTSDGPDFVTKDRHYSKCQWENTFISVARYFFT